MSVSGSLTAGTTFQDSRTPLALWFRASWWVTVQKNGTSAQGLQRILGLSSYVTAWTWLHKLCQAMVRPGQDRLRGRVEVDETCVGGEEPGVHNRQTEAKYLIVIACEEDGGGEGRICLRHIPDASAEILHPFIQEAGEPSSTVHTDGWEGYTGLKTKVYRHQVTVISLRKKTASELLPRVNLVAAMFAGCWGPTRAL